MNNNQEFKSTVFGDDPYWKNVISQRNASINRNIQINNNSYGSSQNLYNTSITNSFNIIHDRTRYDSNGLFSSSIIGW
jgi:hypothetical protein